MDIVALIDNDVRKQNSFIDGMKVIAPEQVNLYDYDKIFLMIAFANIAEMRRQLLEIGVDSNKIATIYDIRKHIGNTFSLKLIQIYTQNLGGLEQRKRIAIFHPVRGKFVNGVDTCLIKLCEVLRNHADIHVIISKDCTLRKILVKKEITVIIDQFLDIKRFDDIYWLHMYDVIFVNSIDMYNLFDDMKNNLKMPVIWWLHTMGEAIAQVPLGRLMNIQHENIHVYSVSPFTKESFQIALPNWRVGILLYGVDDDNTSFSDEIQNNEKLIFAIVGRCSFGKGQDIFADAIMLLPEDIKSKCEFWFVGYMNEKRLYESELLKKVESEKAIKVFGELHGEKLQKMYNNIDVLVCPSRADAMPIVCAEAMMHGHPCIVSENVGTKIYIHDEVDGLICKTGDAHSLASKLAWVAQNRARLPEMGANARNIYLEHFTMHDFEQNILSIVSNALSERTPSKNRASGE